MSTKAKKTSTEATKAPSTTTGKRIAGVRKRDVVHVHCPEGTSAKVTTKTSADGKKTTTIVVCE